MILLIKKLKTFNQKKKKRKTKVREKWGSERKNFFFFL